MAGRKIKGLYLHSLGNNADADFLNAYGVQKKINAQIKAFNHFFECKEVVVRQFNNNLKNKIVTRLPFTAICEKWRYSNIFKDVDFVYFRKNIIDSSIIRFFKKIKRRNPGCKIIFEIPTYPYDKEAFFDFKDLPFKLKDRINRKRLHKYVDRITTVATNNDYIFGCKVINFVNGLDFSSIPIARPDGHNGTINIVVMALFTFWHGYDRLLKGLANYYKNNGQNNYVIYMVGEGVSIPDYKEIVEKEQLRKHVVFMGKLSGEELDKVFDNCDISCDSLGFFRQGLSKSSTLKSREILARGIPLISCVEIDAIDNDFEYNLRVPNNDTDIDFFAIDEFYETRIKNKDYFCIRSQIREYAKKKIDVKETMKPIVDYIKETSQVEEL